MSRPSPGSWDEISHLLDEVLDVPAESRQRWLAALATRDPAAAAHIASWLDEYQAMESDGFLGASPAALPQAVLAGLEVGAYRLVEPIGHGGMGTVWLAQRRDGQFDQRVAVKVLNAALMGAEGLERFSREARILASLTHPSISRLIDAGLSTPGAPYLVLEYVDGEHIDRYCDRHRLDVTARLQLFLDVLAPVAHAHANLVVHRDLKPANVLVTTDRHVKLLDFGIAKLLHPTADRPTLPGTHDGALTPAYAAPEQLTGDDITTATDVYALGVLLYRLLTGRHPSANGTMTPASLIDAIVRREPTAPSAMVVRANPAPANENALATHGGAGHAAGGPTPDELARLRATTPARLRQRLAGDLDTILAKALKKAPAERYASVAALEGDLRRYLRHEPITARPDRVSYRLGKFVRRHRVSVAFAAAAFVALVGGLGGTISQARQATAQARRADQEAIEANAQRDRARRQLARAEAINDLNTFLIADAAPMGSTFTARDLLARAEHILSRQADDGDGVRLESLISLGALYSVVGETSRATAALQRAYERAASSDDLALRARASCELARARVHTGDVSRARALVDEGIAMLPDRPEFAMARVQCHMAAADTEHWIDMGDRAIAHSLEARRVADEAGLRSPLLGLKIDMQLAESYRMSGRLAEANASFARAHATLVAQGREHTERAGTLLNNWGLTLSALGLVKDAERMLRESIAISSAEGDAERIEPISWANLARAVFDLGRYDDALALAERARRGAIARHDTLVADQVMLTIARAHIAAGRLDRGRATLDAVEAKYRRMFPPGHVALVATAIVRMRLLEQEGRLDEAAALGDRTLVSIDREGGHRRYLGPLLERRASISVRRGRYADAIADAQRAIAVSLERLPDGTLTADAGHAYVILGEARLGAGDAERARDALDVAVRHLDGAAGDHPDEAHARALLRGVAAQGEALRRVGWSAR
jgi:serine/threonine-protein kinase